MKTFHSEGRSLKMLFYCAHNKLNLGQAWIWLQESWLEDNQKNSKDKWELFLLQMNHILNSNGFWFVHSVVRKLEL